MLKKITALIMAIIICLSLVSCSGNTTTVKSNTMQSDIIGDYVLDKGPAKGGSLNLFTTKPDTLNPILSKNLYVQEFSKYIYEGLFTLKKDQFPYPALCDEWQISPDGLTWTFHIRQNVLWHDNIPLSSEDIQFTLDTIFNPQSNSIYKPNVQNISSYAAVDRNNFKVILKKPDSFMLENMTFPIISKHTFEGENVLNSPRNMKPVGTGPYKFNSNDGEVIRLGTNEAWWRKTVEKIDNPLITELDVKIYKNAADNLSALQGKDVDVAFADALSSSRYNGNYNISIKKYPTKSFEYTAFNMYRPVTADKSVRQAIAFALDRKKIIEKVLPGGATVSDLPLLPDSWLFSSNPVYFNRDIEKAKNILAQNGWKNTNGTLYKNINGVMRGLTLELLVNADNEIRLKIANEIKSQLYDAGIIVNIKQLQYEQLMNLIKTKTYDMALVGVTITSIPDISFAYSTAEIAGGRNLAGYSNPQVDAILQQMTIENDSQRKKNLFTSLRTVLNEDVPYAGLFFYNNAVLYNKRVRGNINPCIFSKYNDLTQWYIPS